MSTGNDWRTIVGSALDWEQAHVRLDKAVEGLAPDQRGRRPRGAPHSVWELVEHIRLAQRDLFAFCRSTAYEAPVGPDDYWPAERAPADDKAWANSLGTIRKDRKAFERWIIESDVDLTAKIPHGTGQTYLRTILVAVDHTAYHVGQIVIVRRLLGAWE